MLRAGGGTGTGGICELIDRAFLCVPVPRPTAASSTLTAAAAVRLGGCASLAPALERLVMTDVATATTDFETAEM